MKILSLVIFSAFCASPVEAWYLPPPVAVPQGLTVSPNGDIWQNYIYVQPPPQPYSGGAVQQGLDPRQYNASHGYHPSNGCWNLDVC